MRLFYATLIFSVSVLMACTHANAQSGSRGGGFSGGGVSGGAGGFSRGRGSGSGTRGSYADRQRAARERLQQQQALAQEAAVRQAEITKQQFKQSLVQLGLRNNSSFNSSQNRLAFAEAQKDYQALRTGQLAPSSLGTLNVPFRLTRREIDRTGRTAKWPKALQNPGYESIVRQLDDSIMNNTVSTMVEAKQFLADLQTLNQSLNNDAASGRINIKDYAISRRFITGLANEVRASDLVM